MVKSPSKCSADKSSHSSMGNNSTFSQAIFNFQVCKLKRLKRRSCWYKVCQNRSSRSKMIIYRTEQKIQIQIQIPRPRYLKAGRDSMAFVQPGPLSTRLLFLGFRECGGWNSSSASSRKSQLHCQAMFSAR